MKRWLKAVWLWMRIVGRETQGEYRLGPVLAWSIARSLHCSKEQEIRDILESYGMEEL